MSVPKRKIQRYALKVIESKSDKLLSPDLIKECFQHIRGKKKTEAIIEDNTTNRIHYLGELTTRANYGTGYFVSAKHHHRPPLIHTSDLSQRENPKQPEEGEMEKTHFAVGFGSDDCYLLLENKQGGVSIGKFVHYLNNHLRDIKGRGQRIDYDLFVTGDFLNNLKGMPRILCAQIYTGTNLLSDTFLNDATMSKEIKDDIELVMRAKRGQSLKTQMLEWFYKKFTHQSASASSRISRMRIIGKSEDNNPMLLDTQHLAESEYIEVDIDANGQVVTESIFPKLRQMIRNMPGITE